MIIKLKKVEYDILINSQFVSMEIKKKLERGCKEYKEIYILTLNDYIVDEVHEKLIEQFQCTGIGDNGEPTAEGLLIEGLIDKFFTG